MKLEIILAWIAWTSLSIGERLPRSTVLTDESKRILEHFDFSNFDKQEALNNIERQRYEYQIRGKRSQAKLRRRPNGRNTELFSDTAVEKTEMPFEFKDDSGLPPQILEKTDAEPQENTDDNDDLPDGLPEKPVEVPKIVHKKPHQKKFRSENSDASKSRSNDAYDEDEDRRLWKRRRKKRKRRYWDHWTEWTPCSVTCGRGRKIRWRKCIVENCKVGELEMGEKTCQLPACSLITKLLGI